ncbi:MAG: peptide deformylase [Moorella sp. (in: firmicutes)]|uniref:peptide deformylase n=1 Tax=Moorella sp. E308F TaxID=2572682 RepID=UPI0010FFB8CB|nr:peptide deformylase [Moorella sp. E308F]MDK2815647.1 peptide deformylase [Moorella sp. (in: firmicutes)]MDK2894167.1 peptide deformylase [Moorella sp. (in: firmicutes)]GEA15080.1 peptide deformylase [Moorella sp. E308F]
MAIHQILVHPDPILREKSQAVKKITPNIWKLLDNLADTMYDAPGVGLAAPQIGVLKRVIVVDVGEGLIELINPEIIAARGKDVGPEGCLSVPGAQGEVPRAAAVTVRGLDRHGREREIKAEGLLARALQHEIDHLDGVLFIDKVVRWLENNPEER